MQIHPLKAWRNQEGLTQQGAADVLGVTKATICRLEKGERQVGAASLHKFSVKTGIPTKVLRPDLADILGGDRQ